MTPFRALQIALTTVLLFGSAWFVRAAAVPDSGGPAAGGSWPLGQLAFTGVAAADNGTDNGTDNGGDNGSDNGGDNNGGDNGGDNGSNGNSNSNGNGNENGNGNDSFNNDNFDIVIPTPIAPSRPPEPACTTPGQASTFTSFDGKATVRVFPTMPRSIKIQILPVIDFLSVPLPPGNLVGLLVYEIRANDCNGGPLQTLPAEVNLAIHYSDLEAAGLNESNIVIGRLDQSSGTWVPVEKRATDTASNAATATIQDVGFYIVYEER